MVTFDCRAFCERMNVVSPSSKALRDAVLRLPLDERVALAEELFASIGEEEMKEIESAWAREVEDRIDAMESGELKAEPADDLIEMLEKRMKE